MLSRNRFSTVVAFALAATALGDAAAGGDEKALTRPNIIIVLADDMGWRDTSYQASPVVKTPALDAIAAGGVRFDYFYPAQQMCSPGRFSILTGRTPFRTGLHHLGSMRPQEITVAQALKTAGYHTGHFGKWHLGEGATYPTKMGFDVTYFSPNYFDIGGKLRVNDTKETVEVTGDSSVFTMDRAIDWIRGVAKEPKPFFAYVCFGSPHSPHKGAPEFLAAYKDQPKADYWAEVAGIDAAVGKLREELRTLGVADNTLLWFTSDNGGIIPQSQDPAGKGKQHVGVRTVACMEWPARIKTPIRTNVVAAHMDLYPTILEITGVSMPNQPALDGVSLVPLLDGKMQQRPAPVGFMLWNAKGGKNGFAKADFVKDTRGVWIDGQYKLMVPPQPAPDPAAAPGAAENAPAEAPKGAAKRAAAAAAKEPPGVQLFDIYADPAEKQNLAEKMPDQVAKMRTAMEQWQRSVRDSYDGKDYPRAAKPAGR